ncbi:MAG TPA: RIP metalloprotease RseP [Leucothrix sp.]|nr:RIP metalloprotease RseP [Leucothrix sp.]
MTILISIISFIVAIAILVGIHEFGHFWVARKLNIKIIRFAIGFGAPIWTYKSKDKDATEYVLAAIPLGGYVKMLDEREGDVKEEEKHRAFNTQPVWKRFLVVLAGPMFNFFFAIAAFAGIHMSGINSMHPYVGEVQVGTAAEHAGFELKDKIIAINTVDTESATQVRLTLLNEYLKDPRLTIHVETQSGQKATRNLDLTNTPLLADEKDYFEKTGIAFWRPPHQTLINQVVKDGVAQKAGLEAGDIIVSVDNNKYTKSEQFIKHINSHADKEVQLIIERNGNLKTILVTPKTGEVQGQKVGLIGIAIGRKFSETDLKDYRSLMFFVRQAPFLEAMKSGVVQTWDMSIMTLKFMGRLITGEASIKNISGPITIANFAGQSAMIGFSAFFSLLAIVSLSLGVLNLLPIPMLDGGHLLYYFIEVIKGSPVSEKFEAIGMRVGMSLVGVLMIVAMYNDIGRLVN